MVALIMFVVPVAKIYGTRLCAKAHNLELMTSHFVLPLLKPSLILSLHGMRQRQSIIRSQLPWDRNSVKILLFVGMSTTISSTVDKAFGINVKKR